MKAILEFSLPEDKEQFEVASKASDLYFVLWDLDQYLRGKVKYNDLSENEYTIYESTRDKLYELLEEYNCSMDMLS